MKVRLEKTKFGPFALLLTFLCTVSAAAQSIPAGQLPPVPVNTITEEQSEQLNSNGNFIPIDPAVIADQDLLAALKYLDDQIVVAQFIRQHPNLPAFAQLTQAPAQDVAVTSGGDYLIQVPDAQGGTDTIQTMSRATVFADLANSIQTSSDPSQELTLYQELYTQYAGFVAGVCGAPTSASAASANPQCANLPPAASLINPSQLTGASLESIKSAIATITVQGPLAYSLAPVSTGAPVVPSCTGDVGGNPSLTEIHYGDQTHDTCSTPNPAGIVTNFNWPYEDQLTCVKKQGRRGTCHIFAATSAMEQIIARDTSIHVNLSEQDFQEQEKLIWNPSFYTDGGNSLKDLNNAALNKYQFAYEIQWDYNPAYSQPASGLEYVNTCENYPYPVAEPGCSATAPEAPIICVHFICGFTLAPLTGTPSPYMSNGAVSIWDPADPSTSVSRILLELAFDNAVVLGLNLTSDFEHPVGGYITYDPESDFATSEGGHFVHIVGYISNAQLAANTATATVNPGSGGGYFIIKNSWDTCKGDLGFFYMPVDYLTARATGVSVLAFETH